MYCIYDILVVKSFLVLFPNVVPIVSEIRS